MAFAPTADKDYGCRQRGRVSGRPVANSDFRLDPPTGPFSRWWRRRGWKSWTGLGLALVLVAAGAEYLVAQSSLRARLMRADPGTIGTRVGGAIMRISVRMFRKSSVVSSLPGGFWLPIGVGVFRPGENGLLSPAGLLPSAN